MRVAFRCTPTVLPALNQRPLVPQELVVGADVVLHAAEEIGVLLAAGVGDTGADHILEQAVDAGAALAAGIGVTAGGQLPQPPLFKALLAFAWLQRTEQAGDTGHGQQAAVHFNRVEADAAVWIGVPLVVIQLQGLGGPEPLRSERLRGVVHDSGLMSSERKCPRWGGGAFT